MAQKKKRKLKKKHIVTIIIAGFFVLAAASLLITNIFVPVKYLTAYFSYGRNANRAGVLRVNFLDAGNGNCTLVELPDGKILLIDGGDGTYSHNLKLIKELNLRGADKIDYLIASSVANEDCGGLKEILKYKTVGKIFAPYCTATFITDGYENFIKETEIQGYEVGYCEYNAGVENKEAGYSFYFLSPDAHTLDDGEYDRLADNPTVTNIKNASAVIWLEYGGISFLFLGSTGQAVQKKLVETYNLNGIEMGGRQIDLKSCNVVKLSDHGSETGSYAPLLNLAKPQTAIISVGDNGRGYPHLDALSNAQNVVGRNIFRTDECGNITVTVENGAYGVSKEKK